MRGARGGRLFCYLILALLLSPSTGNGGVKKTQCNATIAEDQCGKNRRCLQDQDGPETGHCECERGFYLENEQCVQAASTTTDNAITVMPDVDDTSSGGGGSSVAAGLLIPTFLVVTGVLLYLGARRYKWLQRFRQYRQNRYGNVLVTRDDDDDDVPPIP